MRTRRAERARRRERTARTVRRIGSMRLILNPATMRMEPMEDAERRALEVERVVSWVKKMRSKQNY